MDAHNSLPKQHAAYHPIGPNDTVSVRGKYLIYDRDGSRFLMRGIAFPNPPPPPSDETLDFDRDDCDDSSIGWISILEQMRDASPFLNTIRIYRMNPSKCDYSEFFQRAAELGFYVLVPLTGSSGGSVLDRNLEAPYCYPQALWDYGTSSLDAYLSHSNVLAGILANEVMNSLISWHAAPCIAAYARDLYHFNKETSGGDRRILPLMYSAQHDGIGAAVSPPDALRLTMDYFTCADDENVDDDMDFNKDEESLSFVFGINVESWCSSLQTFDLNEDGFEGSYHALYKVFENSTVPIVFSELGCPIQLFNQDNGHPKGARDWKQLSVVLGPTMNKVWSGFISYTYDGNPMFNTMKGGPWNGIDVLEPTTDFNNLIHELEIAVQNSTDSPPIAASMVVRPACSEIQNNLYKALGFSLLSVDEIPTHQVVWNPATSIWCQFLNFFTKSSAVSSCSLQSPRPSLVFGFGLVVVAFWKWLTTYRRMKVRPGYENIP